MTHVFLAPQILPSKNLNTGKPREELQVHQPSWQVFFGSVGLSFHPSRERILHSNSSRAAIRKGLARNAVAASSSGHILPRLHCHGGKRKLNWPKKTIRGTMEEPNPDSYRTSLMFWVRQRDLNLYHNFGCDKFAWLQVGP